MSRAGRYGPPDAWQMRHAFRLLAEQSGSEQVDSVVEGHAPN